MIDETTDKQSEELAQGCLIISSFTLAGLFASLAVGFIFGAGYGFATAAAIALLQYLSVCRKTKKTRKNK